MHVHVLGWVVMCGVGQATSVQARNAEGGETVSFDADAVVLCVSIQVRGFVSRYILCFVIVISCQSVGLRAEPLLSLRRQFFFVHFFLPFSLPGTVIYIYIYIYIVVYGHHVWQRVRINRVRLLILLAVS